MGTGKEGRWRMEGEGRREDGKMGDGANSVFQTFKGLICLGSSVLVWVELEGQSPVLLLQVCLSGTARDV